MATKRKLTGPESQAVQRAKSAERIAKKAARDAAKLLADNAKLAPPMTHEQMEELIGKVVTATLKSIGLNIKDDDDVEELRKDFEYTRAWRLTIQKTTRTSWLTAVTVLTGGFLSILFIATRLFFWGHP